MPYPVAACRGGKGSGAAAQSSILTGLVSYWKLDEESGTRNDSHGTNHLAAGGTVGYEAGKLGNAVKFEAGSNYLYLATNLIGPATGFTVWGWQKLADTTKRAVILTSAQGNSYADWELMFYNPSNLWRFLVKDSASGDSIAYAGSPDTAWHFVCGRYNSTTKKAEIRVDGGAWGIASSALANGPHQVANVLRVNLQFTSYGIASVDAVGFSGRYLSDDEVSQLYNGGAGLEYPFG